MAMMSVISRLGPQAKILLVALAITTAPIDFGDWRGLVGIETARAQGPQSVADLAEPLLAAVVNISTSQTVKGDRGGAPFSLPTPKGPKGLPFQEFFDEFFNRQQEKNGNNPNKRQSRKVQSLGSGFVIDASGIIITNNHVIADADEITINFTDGSRLKAENIGTDKKTDIAVLRVKPEKTT